MTNRFAHRRTLAELDALFVGRTPTRVLEARAHLESCAGCRAHFERLAAADRAASGVPGAAGPFERAFARACLEATLGERAHRRLSPRRWLALAAAVSIVGLGAGVWRLSVPTAAKSQARGAAATEMHAIELLCVDPDRGQITAADGSADHRLACPLDGELKVAVMNAVPEGAPPLPYLTLASVDPGGVAHRLLPVDPQAGSVSMRVGEHPRMTGLGTGIRLAVNHAPGAWRVHAWFTMGPLSATELETRLLGPVTDANTEATDTWTLLITP